ncbi:MAG: hypothetical protein QHH02_09015 [Syntrophomonadaceae bacterium]|nr:hypothetical protein [Syntrophomonadaceae bacterium]
MHEYLAVAPDGLPWWQIFETCPNLIRTLPGLVYDKHRVEDVSDECEDHAAESCRYALMSRPGVRAGSGLARDRRRERAARGTVEEAMERLRREQEERAETEG